MQNVPYLDNGNIELGLLGVRALLWEVEGSLEGHFWRVRGFKFVGESKVVFEKKEGKESWKSCSFP